MTSEPPDPHAATIVSDALEAGAPGDAFSTTPPEPERVAGRYEILGLLGAGGMGAVYRVRDAELNEVVALKLLRPELLATLSDAAARFRQEVRLARRVTHRNVARTFDIGEYAGGLYLTMEHVAGESLAARIQARGAFPVAEAIGVARDVCAGLSAAHAAGVVHRDLKPDNVLLSSDGRAVITDFGIACAHEESGPGGRVIGTPAYMAPEQVERGAVDGRADLYALGELLYEMLIGEMPWPAATPLMAAAARLTSPPPDPSVKRPSVAGDLAALVLRLMARHAADRFPDADATAHALAALAATPRAAASILPPAPRYPPIEAVGERTVAVLPLASQGCPSYLADGLFEDLVDILSMTRGLRVRSSGTTRRFAGQAVDARDAGEELGVQVVVEGSVRAAGGDRVRVAVRALGVEDGFVLWAKRFDRPLAEVLDVADEVARAVADALTGKLDAPARALEHDPTAAELYLRARAELDASWNESDRIVRVAGLFDAALARAPHDGHLLAGAARAHARVGFFGGPSARAEADKARELAERAIEVAPQLPEPWVSLATIRTNAGDTVGAVRALHAAMRAAPHDAGVRLVLGGILVEAGDVEEAVALLAGAIEHAPHDDAHRWDLARGNALLGDFAAARATLATVPTTDMAHVLLPYLRARLALWADEPGSLTGGPIEGGGVVGRGGRALWRVVTTRALTPEDKAFYDETLAATSGRAKLLVLQILTEVELYIVTGSKERALGFVREAVDAGLVDVAWVDRCPVLAPLRATPDWAALRARVDARAEPVRAAARARVPR